MIANGGFGTNEREHVAALLALATGKLAPPPLETVGGPAWPCSEGVEAFVAPQLTSAIPAATSFERTSHQDTRIGPAMPSVQIDVARTSAGAWTSSMSTPSPQRGDAASPRGWMKQTS